MSKIRMYDLGGAVQHYLMEFEAASYEAIRAAVDKTAKEVISQTKGKAPKKTGVYAKGWGMTAEMVGSRRYSVTVHNKGRKMPLTHLLEHGHGGPVHARAFPHITPDSETEKLFTENLRKEMEG